MQSQKPNAAQIRAALGLLNWENEEMAKICDITPQSVSNIKRGVTRPQPRVLSTIRKVLEAHGIEFLDNSGVRLRPEGVDIFEGSEAFLAFYEIVYGYLKAYGGSVCISGVDENLFAKYQHNQQEYIERVNQLKKERKNIKVSILIREGDMNFVASSYADYRWQSKESFSPTAFYVFGDRLALISFQAENAPKVILIRSAVFAEAYRRQFVEDWQRARIPPEKRI
jgi:transcriptional regulator with XRE-family HTH domain